MNTFSVTAFIDTKFEVCVIVYTPRRYTAVWLQLKWKIISIIF